MLDLIISKSAYLFAVVAGLLLMVFEHYLSNELMIVLICAAVLAHVWLTRRAVTVIRTHERQDAMNTLFYVIREIAAAQRFPRDVK